MADKIITGRAFMVKDISGKLIENIDTDMIFHNKHLAITKIEEMGVHAFGNLDGYNDFPQKIEKGDILVVGENFGCGSSRQQAVDCFRALGISVIIGRSFGPIYYRNCVNSAMPAVVAENIDKDNIEHGDLITIDFETGELVNSSKGIQLSLCKPFSDVQMEIYHAGSIFEYARSKE